MAHKVLIIEDNKYLAAQYNLVLERHGYESKIVFDSDEFFEEYKTFKPEVVVINLLLTFSTLNGIQITRALVYDYQTQAKIIAISSEATPLELKEIRKLGVFTFIEKGESFNLNYLIVNIENAIKYSQNEVENKSLLHHNKNLKKQIMSKSPFLGMSLKIKKFKQDIINASLKEQSLVIYGAPGSGKNIAVNYYCNNSVRFGMPFTRINCKQLSNEIDYQLRHSHLSKSDIIDRKLVEIMEENASGTVHFEEIANLGNGIQLLLTKYLDGSYDSEDSSELPIMLFTTSYTTAKLKTKKMLNSKFKDAMKNNIVRIPSLKSRGDDYLILLKFFLTTYSEQYYVDCELDLEKLKEVLHVYNWPGNVVELKNFCKNVVLSQKSVDNKVVITLFKKILDRKDCNDCVLDLYEMDDIKEAVFLFEKKFLARKLIKYKWKMSEVSRVLGVERSTLYKKIKQFNIERD